MEKTARVLVIDDDEAVLDLLRQKLSPHFSVVTTDDSRKVVDVARANKPDVILCDIDMPHMNGVELVDCLRKRSVDLPAILITGKVNSAVRSSAACSGFRQVLEKPLEDGALLDGIRGALSTMA